VARLLTYLLDTNILLRLVKPDDPLHQLVTAAVERLMGDGAELCYTPQNLVEFWNVLTRPKTNNGFGASPAHADREAALIESRFRLLPDNERMHTEWRRLVVDHSVSGKQVHDARLVAAMVVHGVTHLLTLNTSDFARYPDITAVPPQALARMA
jgi:predicted nucleic acid-binding protein